jgi:hypothetical protein
MTSFHDQERMLQRFYRSPQASVRRTAPYMYKFTHGLSVPVPRQHVQALAEDSSQISLY